MSTGTQRPPLHFIQRKTQTLALVWNLIESLIVHLCKRTYLLVLIYNKIHNFIIIVYLGWILLQ